VHLLITTERSLALTVGIQIVAEVMHNSGRTGEKEIRGRSETLYCAKRKDIISQEGSQASPARPPDTGSVNVKTSGSLEAMAWDRGSGIFIF
jgi:hypothetical protein